MKTHLFLFFLSLVVSTTGLGQPDSPYTINWKWDGLSLAGGIGLNAFFYSNSLKVTPYTEDELSQIPRPNFFKWDEYSTTQFSGTAAEHSNNFLFGSLFVPFVYLAPKCTRKDAGAIGMLYLQTLSYTLHLTEASKQIFLRPRPLVFNPDVEIRKKLEINSRFSFVSGHTSMVAASAFFSAKIFNDYYPESKLRIPVWIAASAITATTGYLRVRAGRHYFTDVLVGGIAGAAVGILVPELHKTKSKKLSGLRISPGYISDGFSVSLSKTF